MKTSDLLEAIAVTAELCGRVLSPAAAQMFCADLSPYPAPQVVAALARCRKEVRGMLTVQDVVSRLDDGRPGPEEAWAALPKDEASSAVWTDEMSEAFGVAAPLLEAGDKIGARMAFKEIYVARVSAARDAGRPVNWTATLGHDPRGRDGVLIEAVARKRLTLAQAMDYSPMMGGVDVLQVKGPVVGASSERARKAALSAVKVVR